MSQIKSLNTFLFAIAALALGACGADTKLPGSESVENITTKKMDRKIPGDLKKVIADSQQTKTELADPNLDLEAKADQQEGDQAVVPETPETGDADRSNDSQTTPPVSAEKKSLSGEENEDYRMTFYTETVDVIQAAVQDESLANQQQFCSAMSALILVSKAEQAPEGHFEQVYVSMVMADYSEKFQKQCIENANEELEDQNDRVLITSLDELLVLNEGLKAANEESREEDVDAIKASQLKSSAMYCQAIALLDAFRQSSNEWATSKSQDLEAKLLTNEFNIARHCPFTVEIDVDKVFSLPGAADESEQLEDAEKYFQDPVVEDTTEASAS